MTKTQTLFLALSFLFLATACDDDSGPPPPIDVAPIEEDPCAAFRNSTTIPGSNPPPVVCDEIASSSDDGGSSESDGSSTGEPPPTCEEFHACTLGCLQIDADWTFGEQARQECADSCEVPPVFDLARNWGTACAKQDLESCVDCTKTCDAGLEACLYFED